MKNFLGISAIVSTLISVFVFWLLKTSLGEGGGGAPGLSAFLVPFITTPILSLLLWWREKEIPINLTNSFYRILRMLGIIFMSFGLLYYVAWIFFISYNLILVKSIHG